MIGDLNFMYVSPSVEHIKEREVLCFLLPYSISFQFIFT